MRGRLMATVGVIRDPESWQEVLARGNEVFHFDPLRGWQPGPAPEVHHRAGRGRTEDETLALDGRALAARRAATLERLRPKLGTETWPPRKGASGPPRSHETPSPVLGPTPTRHSANERAVGGPVATPRSTP